MIAVAGYLAAVVMLVLAIRRADRDTGRAGWFERLVDEIEDER